MVAILLVTLFLLVGRSSSAPKTCMCSNPFQGTQQHFAGDPQTLCSTDPGVCYVQCGSGCSDELGAAGFLGAGLCQSAVACDLVVGQHEARFQQNCKNGVCNQVNVINLKLESVQNCEGRSNCVQNVQGLC